MSRAEVSPERDAQWAFDCAKADEEASAARYAMLDEQLTFASRVWQRAVERRLACEMKLRDLGIDQPTERL